MLRPRPVGGGGLGLSGPARITSRVVVGDQINSLWRLPCMCAHRFLKNKEAAEWLSRLCWEEEPLHAFPTPTFQIDNLGGDQVILLEKGRLRGRIGARPEEKAQSLNRGSRF